MRLSPFEIELGARVISLAVFIVLLLGIFG